MLVGINYRILTQATVPPSLVKPCGRAQARGWILQAGSGVRDSAIGLEPVSVDAVICCPTGMDHGSGGVNGIPRDHAVLDKLLHSTGSDRSHVRLLGKLPIYLCCLAFNSKNCIWFIMGFVDPTSR